MLVSNKSTKKIEIMDNSRIRLACLLYSLIYFFIFFINITGIYSNNEKLFKFKSLIFLLSIIHLFLLFYSIYSRKKNKIIILFNAFYIIIVLLIFLIFTNYSMINLVDLIITFSFIPASLYLTLSFIKNLSSKKFTIKNPQFSLNAL